MVARRGSRPQDMALDDMRESEGEGLMNAVSPLPRSTPTTLVNGSGSDGSAAGKGSADEDEGEHQEDRESMDLELHLDELATPPRDTAGLRSPAVIKMSGSPPPTAMPDERARQLLQCLLLFRRCRSSSHRNIRHSLQCAGGALNLGSDGF